jgi:integrase
MTREHIVGSKIGAQPLDKLRPSHIEAWKVELHRGLSESTIRAAYTILRAVLDTAVRDRALAQNPAHTVRPRVPVTEAAYLAPDQVRSLLLEAKPSRYAPLFELLVNTGLRRGEALALHWSDIDLDVKLLRVPEALEQLLPRRCWPPRQRPHDDPEPRPGVQGQGRDGGSSSGSPLWRRTASTAATGRRRPPGRPPPVSGPPTANARTPAL